ncbi:heterokaryon incompatibility protein-domain-containing protein [Dactylonectria estremocensis]|uniref:Heterokaryon incompatibility protein-domain-containing protein n=1 Tax=Dactylonectria estremocensis TaxID=1079267 RepID=A0A9P9J511_9HYPO|nr:heterokaryon incompatibility protein-domain-containing protein [Dactylonectria estremocensis]
MTTMRLLDVRTYELKTFLGSVPHYAILSHRWQDTEILFEDLRDKPLGQLRSEPAFAKIRDSCEQARRDSFNYIWNDTCCIDKSSSAELSEAINSMFRWYQESSVCYVYLDDYRFRDRSRDSHPNRHSYVHIDDVTKDFCRSKWFSRGWTLQELIAPRCVMFFDRRWVCFGSRNGNLQDRLSECTGILPQILAGARCSCDGSNLRDSGRKGPIREGACVRCGTPDELPRSLSCLHASVKLGWAARRETTRVEDAAYSLMGLFDVNMPLLYGEGRKSFMRLQQEIVKRFPDHSILLWRDFLPWGKEGTFHGALATSTSQFRKPPTIVPWREPHTPNARLRQGSDVSSPLPQVGQLAASHEKEPMEISGTVITTTLFICSCNVEVGRYSSSKPQNIFLGIMDCIMIEGYLTRPALLLQCLGGNLYRRYDSSNLLTVDPGVRGEGVWGDLPALSSSVNDQTFQIPPGLIKADLSQSKRAKIRIVVDPTPIFLAGDQNLESGRLTNEPVYVVLNPCKDTPVNAVVKSGSPPAYSVEKAKLTMPEPWYIPDNLAPEVQGIVAGVHVVDVELPVEDMSEQFYVIWGLQSKRRRLPWTTRSIEHCVPWCRIVETGSCFGQVVLPKQKIAPSVTMINSWIGSLNQEAAKAGAEGLWITDPRGTNKKCLPSSPKDDWSADRVLDIFPKSKTRHGMSAGVRRAQGLGRISWDLQVTFLTPDCAGWQANSFTGRSKDQKPASLPH